MNDYFLFLVESNSLNKMGSAVTNMCKGRHVVHSISEHMADLLRNLL